MIEALVLTSGPASGPLSFVKDIPYFSDNQVTSFKPGLNIIYGPNGSGKSTLVRLLAKALAAYQGGESVVTADWVREVLGYDNIMQLPCDVCHDGQPVMFYDARKLVGLIGGAFDDDFFSAGLANTMARGSTGQLGMRRLGRILRILKEVPEGRAPAAPAAVKKRAGRSAASLARNSPTKHLEPTGFPDNIVWRVSRDAIAAGRGKRLELVDALLGAKCEAGPRTVILDEPESGFSLEWQEGLWTNVLQGFDAAKFQVIVATHSPFALGVPGANYIEMSPGFCAREQAVLLRWAARASGVSA